MTENVVKNISPDLIEINKDNPRLIFTSSKIEELLNSINEVGILVPLTVYEKGKKYILVDGERRLFCAKKLNFPKVPVNVISAPSKMEYLLRMFNIHNVKEEWKLMPTALKLEEIIKEIEKNDKDNKNLNDDAISAITGLTKTTVSRCKKLLTLPKKYQELIIEEEMKEIKKRKFSEDFFLEMIGAMNSINKFQTEIFDKYGRDYLIDSFVKKQEAGKINNITDFRLISKINLSQKKGQSKIKIEKLLTKLIEDISFTLTDAYNAVETSYQMSDMKKGCKDLIQQLNLIELSKRESEEKNELTSLLEEVKMNIEKVLNKLKKY